MKLSADACGVLATVIPVYLLVLYVGGERLVREPGGLKPGGRLAYRIATAFQVLLLTVAEVIAIFGVSGENGLSGWNAAIVFGVSWTVALVTGTQVMLRVLFPQLVGRGADEVRR